MRSCIELHPVALKHGMENALIIIGPRHGEHTIRTEDIIEKINEAGKGAIIFINQNIEPENILDRINKLKDSNNKLKINNSLNQKEDLKDFGIGAQIIHDIGISKIKILSNSGKKPRVGLSGYGLSIDEYIKY